jgi:hypothetical protein
MILKYIRLQLIIKIIKLCGFFNLLHYHEKVCNIILQFKNIRNLKLIYCTYV